MEHWPEKTSLSFGTTEADNLFETQTHTHILRAGLALTDLTSRAKCVLSPYWEAYLKTCRFFHIIW